MGIRVDYGPWGVRMERRCMKPLLVRAMKLLGKRGPIPEQSRPNSWRDFAYDQSNDNQLTHPSHTRSFHHAINKNTVLCRPPHVQQSQTRMKKTEAFHCSKNQRTNWHWIHFAISHARNERTEDGRITYQIHAPTR